MKTSTAKKHLKELMEIVCDKRETELCEGCVCSLKYKPYCFFDEFYCGDEANEVCLLDAIKCADLEVDRLPGTEGG